MQAWADPPKAGVPLKEDIVAGSNTLAQRALQARACVTAAEWAHQEVAGQEVGGLVPHNPLLVVGEHLAAGAGGRCVKGKV